MGRLLFRVKMSHMTLNDLHGHLKGFPGTPRMPALFVGHGSPMNGIEDNTYAQAWAALGASLPRPRAILVVSAHWLTEGSFVHVGERPRTIHDFYGFPEAMYRLRYDCPGSPDGAELASTSIVSRPVGDDADWGLDHGAWIVLRRMYPDADVPTFQLSIDMTRSDREHYLIGRELAALRERGVLIIGSGNIVHNLGMIDFDPAAKAFPWAEEFDAFAAEKILANDDDALIEHHALGHAARMSVPTPEHYWPLLYMLGTRHADDAISFPVRGIAHGSISMRSVLFS